MVVFPAPRLDQYARLVQAREPVLVEGFVPQAAVEAFYISVLDRFAGAG